MKIIVARLYCFKKNISNQGKVVVEYKIPYIEYKKDGSNFFYILSIILLILAESQTDRQTDRGTDRQRDGRTDGRTHNEIISETAS